MSERPHAEADTVIRAARVHLPEVSHQTVYDALNALTAAGSVRSPPLDERYDHV